MFVMGGALLVVLPTFQWALRRTKAPLCSTCYELPTKKSLDANLILGSLVFGVGWGECCAAWLGGWSGVMRGVQSYPLSAIRWTSLASSNLLLCRLGLAAGIGGICPGPALVALASLQPQVALFVAAMLLGMRLDHTVEAVACMVNNNMKAAQKQVS